MLPLGSCDMFLPDSVKGLYAWNGCRVNSSQFIGMDQRFWQGKEDNDAANKAVIVFPETFWSWVMTLQPED
ncbi:hypothetical protein ACFFJT_07210 [Dyella flava]|nr:hypothetical protein [Dyella flava]